MAVKHPLDLGLAADAAAVSGILAEADQVGGAILPAFAAVAAAHRAVRLQCRIDLVGIFGIDRDGVNVSLRGQAVRQMSPFLIADRLAEDAAERSAQRARRADIDMRLRRSHASLPSSAGARQPSYAAPARRPYVSGVRRVATRDGGGCDRLDCGKTMEEKTMSTPTVSARRRLGNSGPEVAPIGLGCMSLSGVYGRSDDQAAIALIHHAIDLGVNHFDSSDMYGWGHNEELLGRALKGRREKVVLATKFGQIRRPGGANGVDGRPEYVIQACEASLRRLGVEVIDVYYQHRVDPAVPVEETFGAMARLVEQGKVRHLGICEARPETVRRAHATHPIVALQSEFSLLYREEASEVRETTRALGISFVAYSPLGRGLLTARVPEDLSQLDPGDTRARHPRYAGENLAKNRELVRRIEAIAAEKGCTPAQLALAWLLAQGPDVVAIPGTKHKERLEENLGALMVSLSPAEVARIAAAIPIGAAAGARYPEAVLRGVYL